MPAATPTAPVVPPAQPTPAAQPPAPPQSSPAQPVPPTEAQLEELFDEKVMAFSPISNIYAAITVPEIPGYDWTARALTFAGPSAPAPQIFEDKLTAEFVHRAGGENPGRAKKKFFAKYGPRLGKALEGFTFVPALPHLDEGASIPLPVVGGKLTFEAKKIVVSGAASVEHALKEGQSLDAAFLFPEQHKLALLTSQPNEEFSPNTLVILDLP